MNFVLDDSLQYNCNLSGPSNITSTFITLLDSSNLFISSNLFFNNIANASNYSVVLNKITSNNFQNYTISYFSSNYSLLLNNNNSNLLQNYLLTLISSNTFITSNTFTNNINSINTK